MLHNQYDSGHLADEFSTSGRASFSLPIWLCALAWLAFHGEVAAQGADTFRGLHPYVGAGFVYDSNLLRQPDDQIDVLSNKKSDRYVTLEAGLDGKLNFSRQSILLDGRIFRNNYDHYGDLDHTGGHAGITWQWLWDPKWSGDIGYEYDRKIRDFSNQVVTIPRKDLRTENRGFVFVSRALGGGYSLNLGASLADVEYEESSRLDIERDTVRAGFVYETIRKNRIGLETEFLNGKFKNADNRDFDEMRADIILDWRLSERNRLDAKFGYAERDNDDSNRSDFDGFTGRFRLVRRGGLRNKLVATVWRDISTFGDEVANYAVVDGISIEPEWGIGRSSALRLFAGYEKRDYKGFRTLDEIPDLDLDSRDDDIYTGSIWYDWQVAEIVTLTFGYIGEIRDSNRDTAEYDFNHLEFKFRVGL